MTGAFAAAHTKFRPALHSVSAARNRAERPMMEIKYINVSRWGGVFPLRPARRQRPHSPLHSCHLKALFQSAANQGTARTPNQNTIIYRRVFGRDYPAPLFTFPCLRFYPASLLGNTRSPEDFSRGLFFHAECKGFVSWFLCDGKCLA
jgi:hypothetical protein